MKIKEFWREEVTSESYQMLLKITRKYDVIVIGGWGAYLWTKAHKSKDIDLIVDYETLLALRSEYNIQKNPRLRKYEIRLGKFDIDLYLPGFSRLALPIETVMKNITVVEGIKVPIPEVLVILKQGAEIDRRHSVKGRKDAIDILLLLLYAPFDIGKYLDLLSSHGLEHYARELEKVITSITEKDLDYLGITFREFQKWKKDFLSMLKSKIR